MVTIIGIFGFIGAVAMLIEAIALFTAGIIWGGLGMLAGFVYVISFTCLMIKLDGSNTKNENRIMQLEQYVDALRKTVGVTEEKIEEEISEAVEQAEKVEETLITAEGEIEGAEKVRFCEKCGYQLFPEDDECPNCHEKVTKSF